MAVDGGNGSETSAAPAAQAGFAAGGATPPLPAEAHGTKRDGLEPAAPELLDAFKQARTMDQAAFDQVVSACGNADWTAVLSSLGPSALHSDTLGRTAPPAV